MNAVEIEEAVSGLVNQPFDAVEFPFQFLAAFGNKDTTLKRLRSGSSNASDIASGLLQRTNIHMSVALPGALDETLAALRESPKTYSAKAKFILSTDGATVVAEDMLSGETLACNYDDLAKHFAFFLPLAGISPIKEIKNNPIDVKATGRLNKLYVELLKDNPEWATTTRRRALNHFMARLIFCFFAEDTGIFAPQQFTDTVRQMTDGQSDNTHVVLAELFRVMDMKKEERSERGVRVWADHFPYVNGALFAGASDSPRFSRIARSYLLRAGELDWKQINPDIFGSMIQAVADDGERGELGMHYTSVPNILKVLNPLFLDDLRTQLDAAGDNPRKLTNLRKRLSMIRVFDPACGSGNFLVVAYKEMRSIEAEIIRRSGDEEKRSVIPLYNFYGIEIKDFAAEIARVALLIAEFQADCLYLSQQEARAMVLPLHKTGQIHVDNALLIDWLAVCPRVTKTLSVERERAGPMGRRAIDDHGVGGGPEPETYICGNPPYLGSRRQSSQQKDDLGPLFSGRLSSWKSLDYVSGWLIKAADYANGSQAIFAFVTTNSINQGLQVPLLWPLILGSDRAIIFAHRSFKWSNLAAHNAGVTVSVAGVGPATSVRARVLYADDVAQVVSVISPYLTPSDVKYVDAAPLSICGLPEMAFGNMPRDGGHLSFSLSEKDAMVRENPDSAFYIFRYLGSDEMINGLPRYCLWIEDHESKDARAIAPIARRLSLVAEMRTASSARSTRDYAAKPHRFVQSPGIGKTSTLLIAGVSSERRPYLPVDLVDARSVASNAVFAIFDGPIWCMAVVASRIHLVWIATVCGKLKTDNRYSNTLGWNTFPVPTLTEKNKADLTRCAEDILLTREAHFPATLADLYDPDKMPADLREAHERNDEVLERIYVGRRFRNDTERLEKLFELYIKMTAGHGSTTKRRTGAGT